MYLKAESSNKSELTFTPSYKGVYLKAESSSKNTEYGYPESRSNLRLVFSPYTYIGIGTG